MTRKILFKLKFQISTFSKNVDMFKYEFMIPSVMAFAKPTFIFSTK